MVKVGIIGFGFMGRTHFECYQANDACEVAGVVTRDPIRRQGKPVASGNLPVGMGLLDVSKIAFHDQWQTLVTDPSIDLIDICTPTHTHLPIALAALAAGKHVLVEKPLARTLNESKQIVQAAGKAKRLLHPAHVLRYWGQYLELKNLTERKELGALKAARFYRHAARPGWGSDDWMADPARSGGVVLDFHIHDVDFALWAFGEPTKVLAGGRLERGLAVCIDATWLYPAGAQVNFHARWDSQAGAPFGYGFYAEYERGTVYCDAAQGAALQLVQGGKTTSIPFEGRSAFQLQLDDVIDTLRAGKLVTQVTPASALATMKMTLRHLSLVERFAGRA